MRGIRGALARPSNWGVTLLLAVGLIQGCSLPSGNSSAGSERPADQQGRVDTASSNPTQTTLMALTPKQQAAILGKAAGKGCVGRTAFFMGMTDTNSAIWSVRCSSGRTYAIAIDADAKATTSAMTCSAFKAEAHVDCFKKF